MASGMNATRDQAVLLLVDAGFTVDRAERIVQTAKQTGSITQFILGQYIDVVLNQDNSTFWFNFYTKDENGVIH
jgi:hypothetical protein